MPSDDRSIRHRVGTWVRQHQRAAGIGITASALTLLGAAVVLASAILNGPEPSGDAEATSTPIMTAGPTARPSSSPSVTVSPTVSPTATPTSAPATAGSASFSLLPAQPPADFVSEITCDGSIGASDPVAIVELRTSVGYGGDVVLRDYADPANPRTACRFAGNIEIEQLIDSRHVVIYFYSPVSYTKWHAVVDLPEVRYHWFQLPVSSTDSWSTLVAVAPGLDQVVWLRADIASNTDEVRIATSAGEHVVASLPNPHGGRCGTGEDSKVGAFTRSGAHFFVLDQPLPSINSLLVAGGQEALLTLIPPAADWPSNGYPAWALWSPTSETLFYRQAGDVWQWSPAGGTQRYLSGVQWYFPTITPDGSHLAYSLVRADGLHDVYLVDLAQNGSPQLIAEARNFPRFVNDTQLWYRSEDQGVCGPGSDEPLIYSLADGSESPSIIEWVQAVWPATSASWR